MPNTLQGPVTLAGRVMIVLIFLMSAVGNKIPNFAGVAEVMAGQGVPLPQVMLAGAILFLVAGSLSIVVGYQARIGAVLLLVFLLLATYFFHDFWTWSPEARWVLSTNDAVQMPVQQIEMIAFMKNLSLMGAMLFLAANGPGPWSLDERRSASSPA